MILVFQTVQIFVIDAFTLHAASGALISSHVYYKSQLEQFALFPTALAAVSFLRSLAGFGFPLFAPAMYSALGYGKGNTILAVVSIVLGCPA